MFKNELHKSILFSFSKTALVGGLATVMDVGVLTLLVQGFLLTPRAANFPSLFVGSLIQFLGNRYFVFKAGGREFGRHAVGFVSTEFIAFFLNGVSFDVLVHWTSINYVLARLLGTFIVFVSFSYPMWRWVFREAPQQNG
jgi:putative flippase GtrA